MSNKIKRTSISRNIFLYEVVSGVGTKENIVASVCLPKEFSFGADGDESTVSKDTVRGFLGINLSALREVIDGHLMENYSVKVDEDSVEVKIDSKSMSIPLSIFNKRVSSETVQKAKMLLIKASDNKIDGEMADELIDLIKACATKDISKKDEIMRTLGRYMSEGLVAKVFLNLFSVFGIQSLPAIESGLYETLVGLIKRTYISEKELNKNDVIEELC